VGAHNVIISPDGERVWIIDFEAGNILPEGVREESIRGEMEDVSRMFEDLGTGKYSQFVFESWPKEKCELIGNGG
jgi:predicted Ser/Thr protein kinase